MSIEGIKKDAKLFIDQNVWDGEDRANAKCDKAIFNPSDLQELIDEMLDDILKPLLNGTKIVKQMIDAE